MVSAITRFTAPSAALAGSRRSLSDEAFKLEREKNDWQGTVADDFARWLNYRLKKSSFDVGAVEQREWRSQSLFAQRMREMEAVLQEALK